jgi:tetratricopeptide (TPR) repeat protein
MEAYARQRWHDLNRIIVSSPRQRTFLELLRAAQARYVGDYSGAIDVLRQELARDKGTREYDNLLHLALALSLGDRGDRAETYEHLQEALRLQPTCRLCLSTLALRRAEDVALSDAAEPRAPLSGDQSLALAALTKALHGAPIPHSERVEALLVGSMAAMTRILLLDIQAYVLLKTGFAATVAPMLQQCVHEDPYFASGYLHLGEYYLIRRVSRDRAKTGTYPAVTGQHSNSQADLELWLATLCIEIALELEAGRDSLVARRARELLAAARAERPVIALDCYRPQGPGSGSVGASAA